MRTRIAKTYAAAATTVLVAEAARDNLREVLRNLVVIGFGRETQRLLRSAIKRVDGGARHRRRVMDTLRAEEKAARDRATVEAADAALDGAQ